MIVELLALVALTLVNGLFSGAEIAILSVRATRVDELLDAGRSGARALARLRRAPDAFLATVQVAITVIGATAAAFGASSLAEDLAPVVARVAPELADEIALVLVVAVVSALSIVLGELVPKSLALRSSERYALAVAPLLEVVARAATPLVALLTGASNLLLRPFGDRTSFTEARFSREEIEQIVEEAASAGALDARSSEIALRALQFASLPAAAVLVPRRAMAWLPANASPGELAALARDRGHSRVPVRGSDGAFVGFVHVREVLAAAVEGRAPSLEPFVRPVEIVAAQTPLPVVLSALQSAHAAIALVEDEHGTILGMLTVQDVVEELVGELFSEAEHAEPLIVPEGADAWIVSGLAPLHELNRTLGLQLQADGYTTLAGLCLARAGALPPVGWSADLGDGVRITVVEASDRRVRKVRVERTLPAGIIDP